MPSSVPSLSENFLTIWTVVGEGELQGGQELLILYLHPCKLRRVGRESKDN